MLPVSLVFHTMLTYEYGLYTHMIVGTQYFVTYTSIPLPPCKGLCLSIHTGLNVHGALPLIN